MLIGFKPQAGDEGKLFPAILKIYPIETEVQQYDHIAPWVTVSACEEPPKAYISTKGFEWPEGPWNMKRPWQELRLRYIDGKPEGCTEGYQVDDIEILYGPNSKYVIEWRPVNHDNLVEGIPDFTVPYDMKNGDLVYLRRPQALVPILPGRYSEEVKFEITDNDTEESFFTSEVLYVVTVADSEPIPKEPIEVKGNVGDTKTVAFT